MAVKRFVALDTAEKIFLIATGDDENIGRVG